MAWQLPRVQTVYGCYVAVISLQQTSARDTYNFPAVRMGLSCLWKQLFVVRSITEVK